MLLTSVPAPLHVTARAARIAIADESAFESPAFSMPRVTARSSAPLATFQSPLPPPELTQTVEPGVRLHAITDPPVLELGARAVCTVTLVNEDV